MELDSANRFSSRVEAYARHRPSYPRELLKLLERECGLTRHWEIADIGSGTGLLSRLFLDYGCQVTGVEPNPKMRAAAGLPGVDGCAEATTLPSHSVDLVTAGQAFHWFDQARARQEFQRILKPGGWVALIWNERVLSAGFMTEHEEFLNRFAREKRHPGEAEFDAFYGAGNWRLARLTNSQTLDEDGLRGRVESSSWSPLPGSPGYAEMEREVSRLFRKYQQSGRVTIEYETRIYYGRLG